MGSIDHYPGYSCIFQNLISMSSNKNKLGEQIGKLIDSYLSIQTHRRFSSRAYLTLATKEYLEDSKEQEKLLDSHERLQDFLDFLEEYEKEEKKNSSSS